MGNSYAFWLPYADIALVNGREYTVVSGLPVGLRSLQAIGKNHIAHELDGTPRIYMIFGSDGTIKISVKANIPAESRIRIYEAII